jgi:hypothetical protein
MKDIIPDYLKDIENLDESEKLDHAFDEMALLYRSRCIDVPLTSNVKVVEIEKKEEKENEAEIKE